jgi:hypothetical protein
MKKRFLGGLAALMLAAGAQATTVSLGYEGAAPVGQWTMAPGAVASGSGSLSFTQTSGAVSLEDLSAFSFTLTFTYQGVSDVFNISLADLLEFSATLTDGQFSAFSLLTEHLDAPHNWGMALEVSDLGVIGANTFNFDIPGSLSVGQFSATLQPSGELPEPGALSLVLAAGLAGVALRRRQAPRA